MPKQKKPSKLWGKSLKISDEMAKQGLSDVVEKSLNDLAKDIAKKLDIEAKTVLEKTDKELLYKWEEVSKYEAENPVEVYKGEIGSLFDAKYMEEKSFIPGDGTPTAANDYMSLSHGSFMLSGALPISGDYLGSGDYDYSDPTPETLSICSSCGRTYKAGKGCPGCGADEPVSEL